MPAWSSMCIEMLFNFFQRLFSVSGTNTESNVAANMSVIAKVKNAPKHLGSYQMRLV